MWTPKCLCGWLGFTLSTCMDCATLVTYTRGPRTSPHRMTHHHHLSLTSSTNVVALKPHWCVNRAIVIWWSSITSVFDVQCKGLCLGHPGIVRLCSFFSVQSFNFNCLFQCNCIDLRINERNKILKKDSKIKLDKFCKAIIYFNLQQQS